MDNLKRCGIHPQSLVSVPLDRGQWRSTCRTAIAAFEEAQVASLEETGSPQGPGRQQHQHGTAVWSVQQSLLIQNWALCPTSYPSTKQSVVLDGAVHVCVTRRYCIKTAKRTITQTTPLSFLTLRVTQKKLCSRLFSTEVATVAILHRFRDIVAFPKFKVTRL